VDITNKNIWVYWTLDTQQYSSDFLLSKQETFKLASSKRTRWTWRAWSKVISLVIREAGNSSPAKPCSIERLSAGRVEESERRMFCLILMVIDGISPKTTVSEA